MNKEIWYGAKDSTVRFAASKDDLATQGIQNPQSFTVDGEVTGLNLITPVNEQAGQGQGHTTAQAS